MSFFYCTDFHSCFFASANDILLTYPVTFSYYDMNQF